MVVRPGDDGNNLRPVSAKNNALISSVLPRENSAESVEVATLYAVFLEKAARIQLLAMASGDPSWTSDEESVVKYEQIYTPHRLGSMWDYFVRRDKKLRKSA